MRFSYEILISPNNDFENNISHQSGCQRTNPVTDCPCRSFAFVVSIVTGRARCCAKCSKPSPSSMVPSQQTPLPVRGAACHTQNKMLARAELDIRISRCAGRFYPTDQHRSSALRGDAGRWKANLRGSKRHVKWVPSRRKSSFIYVALRGIARKNDVSLTPTVQPKRATGAL
jgi:hypothetical protein